MAKRRAISINDFGPRGYFALPKVVMEHEDFRSLAPTSAKVLTALMSQYNGRNNGDLSATHTTMKSWGGMAHSTLAKALRELLDRRLIVRTRDRRIGQEGARCALYAITWQPIDPCNGKLDVADTNTPPRSWGK